MTPPKLLDIQAVADLLGVSYGAVKNYHTIAKAHRRLGEPRPGDFPEPDDTFGRSPVWKQSTITAWQRRRPGRGAGGGPKPKHWVDTGSGAGYEG